MASVPLFRDKWPNSQGASNRGIPENPFRFLWIRVPPQCGEIVDKPRPGEKRFGGLSFRELDIDLQLVKVVLAAEGTQLADEALSVKGLVLDGGAGKFAEVAYSGGQRNPILVQNLFFGDLLIFVLHRNSLAIAGRAVNETKMAEAAKFLRGLLPVLPPSPRSRRPPTP